MDWLLESLTDPEEAAAYINAAYEDSDEMFLTAILDVARAHKIANVSRMTGVTREHLHRTFSKQGNPKLKTLDAVLHSLGLKRGPVVTLLEPKKPSSFMQPSKVLHTRKRISRTCRALIHPRQSPNNVENPAGVVTLVNAKPILDEYVSQAKRASQVPLVDLKALLENNRASTIAFESCVQGEPGAKRMWFPLPDSAGVEQGLHYLGRHK